MRSVFERAIGVVALLILSPVLTGIVFLILILDGRPVIFTQKRTGLHGRPFKLYKFRTMRYARVEDALPDERRLTGVGRFLRRFSLDELPQLVNVVRGELALVGPRPLLHKYWERGLYGREQRRRFDVKPGLTGWAQVNGRNSLTWEEKFDLDVWYVDHRSFRLDLKICKLTASGVLLGRGISQNGHATAEEFTGPSDAAS